MLLLHAAGLVKRKGLKRQGSSSPEVLKVFLGSTGFHRGASGEVWGLEEHRGAKGAGSCSPRPRLQREQILETTMASVKCSKSRNGLQSYLEVRESGGGFKLKDNQ